MSRRRGLGRGLGALIPAGVTVARGDRPVDIFFPGYEHAQPGDDTESGLSGPHSQPPADQSATSATPDAAQQPADALAVDMPAVSRETAAVSDDLPTLRPVPGARFLEIPIDQISPNPRQPRQVFDSDELVELAASIREVGVLQPVVVRHLSTARGTDEISGTGEVTSTGVVEGHGSRYELIMGERRWRASQLAGLAAVPAIVRETGDDELLRDALLENLHRSQLNALEEAAAYAQLLEDFGCTHDELARRIGRSRPQISNTIRLLRLPPQVQRRVAAGVLTAGHARALLALDDAAQIERLATRVVAEGMSVRAVEEAVALGGPPTAAPSARRPRPGARHPQLDEVSARLSDRLDTRVTITLGRRKGRLSVEFASIEDLDRILAVLDASPEAVPATVEHLSI